MTKHTDSSRSTDSDSSAPNSPEQKCPNCGSTTHYRDLGYCDDPSTPTSPELTRLSGEQAEERTAREGRFLIELLRFVVEHDMASNLHWYFSGGELTAGANCSDVFWWGTADSEPITPENFDLFRQTVEECDALERTLPGESRQYPSCHAEELFAARVRKMRPQTPSYNCYPPVMWPLFDACGPERECDFLNPGKRISPEEYTIKGAERADTYEQMKEKLSTAQSECSRLASRVEELEKLVKDAEVLLEYLWRTNSELNAVEKWKLSAEKLLAGAHAEERP